VIVELKACDALNAVHRAQCICYLRATGLHVALLIKRTTDDMADESLLTLANEVRGKTLRLLDGVPDDMTRFTGGLSNSVLWHAGHALMLVEHLCIMPATGAAAPQHPKGWFELFGWNSRPALIAAENWPALSDVVTRLRDQLQRLLAAIQALPPERLAQTIDPFRNRTLRYSIVHGLHDEATHQGEIYLLKKLYGKRTVEETNLGS